MTVTLIAITCSGCEKSADAKPTKRANARTPSGWKRIGNVLLCPACMKKRYRLAAVTFPVATVIEAEWKDFTAALKTAWGRSTELANWAVRQLLAGDADRKAADEKLVKMPAQALYRLWTDTYHDRTAWGGAAQAANSILHSVEAKYRQRRYEVLWLNSAQPPRYTYPTPYPVHNAAWKAEYRETTGTDGQIMRVPVVGVTIDGRRWQIVLRGGLQRRRQLASFAQLASGEAMRGELAIYRRRSSEGTHRRTQNARAAGGGPRVSYRIMVKLVAWLPRPKEERVAEGTLEIRTGRKALLVGIVPGWERPWLYHADGLRGVIRHHERRLQSISDDLKAERRPASAALKEHLATMAYRRRCRVTSEIQRMAAMVVGTAKRQKLAGVVYSDRERRYCEKFPWHELESAIKQACDVAGLEYHHASAAVMNDDEEPESEVNNGNGEG